MTPDQWSDLIYEATGMVVTRDQAQAIGALVERQTAPLVAERDRLAAALDQMQRDWRLPWIDRAGDGLVRENLHLRAALRQAEEGLRDAGAIYGADAVRAALGEAG